MAYSDYQAAENLHLPRQLAISAGKNEIDFQVQTLKVNAPIDDAKFAAH